MTQLAVIQIEGVLAHVTGVGINTARPTEHGLGYYELCRRQWRVALVSGQAYYEDAQRWLRANRFEKYDKLVARETGPDRMDIRSHMEETLVNLRSEGWEVGPVVTGDTLIATWSLRLGMPTLLVAYPAYLRPEHRPDAVREPRPWDTLVEEIEIQRELKSTDKRLEAEDVIGGARPDA